MVETVLGFEGIAVNVWLVWILPFIGAAAIAEWLVPVVK
jgi:hypothetical protein